MKKDVQKMTLQDVKLFLLDMDGTFYLGDRLIEGSLDFIERVKATGRDFLFLTNNSSHNADFYVQRLRRMINQRVQIMLRRQYQIPDSYHSFSLSSPARWPEDHAHCKL